MFNLKKHIFHLHKIFYRLDFIFKLFTIFPGIVFLIYCLGFFVINLHLNNTFQYIIFDIINYDYLKAGLSFSIFFFFCFFLPGFFVVKIINDNILEHYFDLYKMNILFTPGILFIIVFFHIVFLFIFYSILTKFGFLIPLFLIFSFQDILFYFTYLALFSSIFMSFSSFPFKFLLPSTLIYLSIFLIIIVIIHFIVLFSTRIYPILPSNFGGIPQIKSILVFEQPKVNSFKNLNILSDKEFISKKVNIIYQSNSTLYIMEDLTKRKLTIEKSCVVGIVDTDFATYNIDSTSHKK